MHPTIVTPSFGFTLRLAATIYETSDSERVTIIDGRPVCTCRLYAANGLLYGVGECNHTRAIEEAVTAERTQPQPYRFLNTETGEMEEIIDF